VTSTKYISVTNIFFLGLGASGLFKLDVPSIESFSFSIRISV